MDFFSFLTYRIIPSRLLHRWDVRKHKLCDWGAEHVRLHEGEPTLHVLRINPRIYEISSALRKLRVHEKGEKGEKKRKKGNEMDLCSYISCCFVFAQKIRIQLQVPFVVWLLCILFTKPLHTHTHTHITISI